MALPDITFVIGSNTVAWYGAIVATVGAGISIFNAWHDRAHVKIRFQKGLRLLNARPPYSSDSTYYAVHITNRGRRPVAIGTVGVKYVSGKTFLLSGSLDNQKSRVLTEENPHTMILTDQEQIDLAKLHTIMVYDLSGREYRKYLTRFPTLDRLLYLFQYIGKAQSK